MDNSEITLPQHEVASEMRAEVLGEKIDELKGTEMGQPVNVFTTPTGGDGGSALPLAAMAMGSHGGLGGVGGGLGAGLVGGLLGGLLFGGRGFGNWGGGAVVDGVASCNRPQSADMSVTQSMGIMTAIGGVKDSVTMGNQMLSTSIDAGFAMQNATTLQQSIMLTQQANMNQQMVLSELCNINQNVSAQGCQTREAVVCDGDRTRALLSARFQMEDQTEINKLNAKVIELQNEGRQRELGNRIEINNTAIAAQQQGQQQQQQQQLVTTVNSLFPLLQGIIQLQHATNGNVIAGNAGAVTTGAQTASPVNVAA